MEQTDSSRMEHTDWMVRDAEPGYCVDTVAVPADAGGAVYVNVNAEATPEGDRADAVPPTPATLSVRDEPRAAADTPLRSVLSVHDVELPTDSVTLAQTI